MPLQAGPRIACLQIPWPCMRKPFAEIVYVHVMTCSWDSQWWDGVCDSRTDDASDSDGDFDPESCSPETAQEEFRNFVVSLKTRGCISAKAACTLCFWAMKSGAGGCIRELAYPPVNKQSGKYSLHFDKIVYGQRPTDLNYYRVRAPGHRRADDRRVYDLIPVMLPHEIIAEEFNTDGPRITEKMQDLISKKELPPVYMNHLVVKNCGQGEVVLPLTFYLDGVQTSREDNTLGMWMQNICTGRRWLLCALRKSELCKCGCKGSCRMHPIFSVFEWSLHCLSLGVFPSLRHDGSEFEDDDERIQASGQNIGCRAALVAIKGDWLEWASTLGFSSWSSANFPCPLCHVEKHEMCASRGLSPVTFPFSLKVFDDYEAGCRQAERRVEMSDAQWRRLRSSLEFKAKKGRVLMADVPSLDLKAGDRLEPSARVADISRSFDQSNPGAAVFWRISEEGPIRRRIPLFSQRIGSDPYAIMGSDWLHTFSLGVVRCFNGWLVWALVLCNAWDVPDKK